MADLLNRLTMVVIVLLVISGCEISGDVVRDIKKEDVKDISVYFCPRDYCGRELSSFILNSKEYVYCAFFDLDLENVMAALDNQKKKGLDVKLIVDSDNYYLVKNMSIEVMEDNRSAFMHNKFCVVDDKWISSGSMNPTINGDGKNSNNLIFLRSYGLAENYKKEFEEMWKGVYGKGEKVIEPVVYLGNSKVENYFCPEDNCGEKIKERLRKANSSIYFMSFSFTHDGIANVLLLKNLEGVNIKGIFEKRGTGSEYSKFSVFDYQGIEVRKDNNSGAMHHKVFIIDRKIVITGSFNPSKNADKRNDENILIIYDEEVAQEYLREFVYLW